MEILRESAAARSLGEGAGRTGLSVCCMTSGRRPELLAAVLEPLRQVAHEIVVAVERERAAPVRAAVSGIADTVLSFPATAPADRPIAWLFHSCAGSWIFNVDDDEIPSPALVRSLPLILDRGGITHAWVARRWLYPTLDTYLVSPPWGTEFQLRLVLADERFVQFSDDFHRPVVCHGPSAYVEAPLWHLDTVLNAAAYRRLKAASYERERPGMRIAGLSHNVGLYVPELYPDPELAGVPDEDRAAIDAALTHIPRAETAQPPKLVEVDAAAVDRCWVGQPFDESLYRAELALVSRPPAFYAGAQATVDVRVTNGSERVWRWGAEARPAIRLAYRWRRGDEVVRDEAALLTVLPADVPPGRSEVVPVHVVPPWEPGPYELELDLVHEGVRPFGVAVRLEAEVRPRRQLAVIAPAHRIGELAHELDLPPDVELVAVLRDVADRDSYGEFAAVQGPRQYLLGGSARRGRVRTLAGVLYRTATTARGAHGWARPEYGALLALRSRSDALLIDAPNWELGAAFGREWAWVAATALLWRLGRKPVYLRDEALPGGAGARERSVRTVLRALRS